MERLRGLVEYLAQSPMSPQQTFALDECGIQSTLLDFVQNICRSHRQTFTEFPQSELLMSLDSEMERCSIVTFLTKLGYRHYKYIGSLLPEVIDLRDQLVPWLMTDVKFWFIYFTLVTKQLRRVNRTVVIQFLQRSGVSGGVRLRETWAQQTDDTTQQDALNLWIPDSFVGKCLGCGSVFSLRRRRHHCRECGGVFCASCSEFRCPMSVRHRRICRRCNDRLTLYKSVPSPGVRLSPTVQHKMRRLGGNLSKENDLYSQIKSSVTGDSVANILASPRVETFRNSVCDWLQSMGFSRAISMQFLNDPANIPLIKRLFDESDLEQIKVSIEELVDRLMDQVEVNQSTGDTNDSQSFLHPLFQTDSSIGSGSVQPSAPPDPGASSLLIRPTPPTAPPPSNMNPLKSIRNLYHSIMKSNNSSHQPSAAPANPILVLPSSPTVQYETVGEPVFSPVFIARQQRLLAQYCTVNTSSQDRLNSPMNYISSPSSLPDSSRTGSVVGSSVNPFDESVDSPPASYSSANGYFMAASPSSASFPSSSSFLVPSVTSSSTRPTAAISTTTTASTASTVSTVPADPSPASASAGVPTGVNRSFSNPATLAAVAAVLKTSTVSDLPAGMSHEQIAEHLICPITQEIMVDPVVAADGHTYERKAIQEWIARGQTKSPMTGEPLFNTQLTPNYSVRSMIQNLKDSEENIKASNKKRLETGVVFSVTPETEMVGAEHELQQALDLLMNGATLIKYGRMGAPKSRHVAIRFLDQDNTWIIEWYDLKRPKRKSSLPLPDVVAVAEGTGTPLLKKKAPKGREQLCFSLVTLSRSLDLEAESVTMRHNWVKALRIVVGLIQHK